MNFEDILTQISLHWLSSSPRFVRFDIKGTQITFTAICIISMIHIFIDVFNQNEKDWTYDEIL